MGEKFKVITFYEFKDMSTLGDLVELRDTVRMSIRGRSMDIPSGAHMIRAS